MVISDNFNDLVCEAVQNIRPGLSEFLRAHEFDDVVLIAN
jgi:hypothetical protein